MIAGQLHLGLPPLHFRLLEADKVGVQRQHGLREALFQTGPQAVYVPRYKFHLGPTRFLFSRTCITSTAAENASAPSIISISGSMTKVFPPRRRVNRYFSRR